MNSSLRQIGGLREKNFTAKSTAVVHSRRRTSALAHIHMGQVQTIVHPQKVNIVDAHHLPVLGVDNLAAQNVVAEGKTVFGTGF